MTRFTTDRLVAVPVTLDHAPLFERLWGDARVGRTLGGTRNPQQVHDVIVAATEHWTQHGFGRWLLRAGTEPVGTVKLSTWNGRGRPEVELGYALFPQAWGAGYATEAAHGALEHARLVLRLREVVAFALPENGPSLAVMQRVGFQDEQRLLIAGREHILRHCYLT